MFEVFVCVVLFVVGVGVEWRMILVKAEKYARQDMGEGLAVGRWE